VISSPWLLHCIQNIVIRYITPKCDEYQSPPGTFALSAMLPKSFDIVDKILQYTVVAANALQDVAAATQIPFLNSVCTLSLTIIPIVQVCQADTDLPILSH
jgi:hypothetical protein